MTQLTSPLKTSTFMLFLGAVMFSIFAYLIARTTLFLLADYQWYDKIAALFLLLAETFIMIHALGYFLNLHHATKAGRAAAKAPAPAGNITTEPQELRDYPGVAVIVSSFNEPIPVVEETLICFYNLTYPNKQIFFLDDTRYDLPGQDRERMADYRRQVEEMCARIGVNLFRRRWRGAKAGMINDFLAFLNGTPPEGFEFVPGRLAARLDDLEYIAVFDADMNPLPDFAEPLVARMEAAPRLAFIQTPQYYSNFETNRVARASGMQQAVFYEYICEGKSSQDAMFCCGTNVLFRRRALDEVGGFDESSVTEDFATSLKFHTANWHSAYLNKVSAFGMGPEDLAGYFKQQFRWALGTVGLFRTIVGAWLRDRHTLSIAKWWEYTLSGTHYFVGWVFLIMVLSPVLFLLFNLPSFFARPDIYLLFFFPYIVLTSSMFLFTISQRRYRFRELLTGILLQALSFPVYIKASLLGILGYRGSFKTTPKTGSTALPLGALWPQLTLAMACLIAVTWGVLRLIFERDPLWALTVNTIWCFYHLLILLTILYFNNADETLS